MLRLCLLSHSQPAANPRLVRDAGALAAAGYEVRVVTTQLVSSLIERDKRLVGSANWRYEPVSFSSHRNGFPSWNYIRTRRRLFAEFATRFPTQALVARAYGYANPELARVAEKKPADLFVAYQHNS